MKLQIKLIGRDPFAIEVTPETHIRSIKQKIHKYLRVPVDEQRLLFEGQILKDEKKIKHFAKLQENSKLNLIVITQKKHPLYNKMYEIVRPHCSEKETQKILSVFMRKIYDSFRLLSLDDLERIAHEALENKSGEERVISEEKLKQL